LLVGANKGKLPLLLLVFSVVIRGAEKRRNECPEVVLRVREKIDREPNSSPTDLIIALKAACTACTLFDVNEISSDLLDKLLRSLRNPVEELLVLVSQSV